MSIKYALLAAALCAFTCAAQPYYPQIQYVTVAPSGNCGSTNLALLTPGGVLYTCQDGKWATSPTGGGGGGGTTPGYQPNEILSGCGVEYTSGLSFTVGACNYTILGATYNSAITNVTLSAADPTNPRIDVIGVDNTGNVFRTTGTPAASPAEPSIDPSTQLGLIFITVAANATTPSGITTTLLYDEAIEWACASTANINCASTNDPYHGTKDIEATNAVLGNNFTLVKPASGTVDLSTQNTLVFYIRSKAQWPNSNGSGPNGTRTLSLFWLNGSTQVGSTIVINDGAFGFSSSNITAYQQISIPISLFGASSNLVTTLKAQVTGNGGTSSFGWYIDEVTLQSGSVPAGLPTTVMNFRGTWNSTTAYNTSDTVVSGGIGYVALSSNTNVAVTTTSTWAVLSSIPTNANLPGSPTTTTQSASDNSTKIATTAYVTTGISNAIAGVNPAIAVQAATTLASNTSGFTYNNGVAGIGATFTGTANTAVVIDGFTFTALGQRLLVKNDTQSPSGAFNGVYYVTQVQTSLLPPILTRALDYDQPSDINNTGAIPVVNGTLNGSTSWLLTSTVNTVGTDALTYVKFSLNPTSSSLRTCIIDNDTQSATALVAAQFSGRCVVPAAATIVEVDVLGGTGVITGTAAAPTVTGTSSIQIGKYTPNGGSSTTGLLSAALATASGKACALTATSGTCINGTTSSGSITISTTALAAGDVLYVSAATPDTAQTWYNVTVVYTIN